MSSDLTFLAKYVQAPLVLIAILMIPDLLRIAPRDRLGAPVEVSWIALGIVMLAGLQSTQLARVKWVYLEGDRLRVSNGLHTTLIPLRRIKLVSGGHPLTTDLIYLRLNESTDFGSTIVFMPKLRLFPYFSPHPTAVELRELVGRARRPEGSDGV